MNNSAHRVSSLSNSIIAWQRQHGRHTLPWQHTRDPYAIWVSEIMLQQTQVAAVIPYYQRFMARFPDIASLAAADQDAVLQHWSGLGYYSRARNLHAAAQRVMTQHGGIFPLAFDAMMQLPGIGRSTAAAIAVFAFGARHAILDGNVKRVFARYFGVEGWPGLPSVEKPLWEMAEQALPVADLEAYTQGLMDLGATLCRRSKPACAQCPLRGTCVAERDGKTAQLPASKPRKPLPERQVVLLLLMQGNETLLQKRPPHGIWGGLWSLPELPPGQEAAAYALHNFGLRAEPQPQLPGFTHSFTHFRLRITPQPLKVSRVPPTPIAPGLIWLDLAEARGAALPAPVKKLLTGLS